MLHYPKMLYYSKMLINQRNWMLLGRYNIPSWFIHGGQLQKAKISQDVGAMKHSGLSKIFGVSQVLHYANVLDYLGTMCQLEIMYYLRIL